MKDFLYFLVEEDGRCRQIRNGVIQSLNKKVALTNTPDGWQEILIGWQRGGASTGYSNLRNFSLEMGFVNDGAMILRDAMYKNNIDRKLFLLIKQLTTECDDLYFKQYYKFFYKGELDFSTFQDEPGNSKVKINIMEGGIQKKLKSQDGTKFDVEFDDNYILIRMDGIYLQQTINFVTQGDSGGFGDTLIGMLEISKEGQASGLVSFTVYTQGQPADFTTSTEYFLQSIAAIPNVRLVGTIQVRVALEAGTFNLRLKSNQGRDDIIYSQSVIGTLSGTEISAPIDFSFNAGADEKFFLIADVPNVGSLPSGWAVVEIKESNLSIVYKSRFKTTYIKAYLPYNFYKKLGAKSTGSQDDFEAGDLLKNCTYAITCGDAIRGLPDPKIKTSFKDWFKAYDVMLMAGYGFENGKIYFDDRKHFFKTDTTRPLGDVRDFKVSPSTDLFYTSVKIGHEEPTVDDVNGKNEFNGHHIYKLPISRIPSKEMDLLSPYNSSPYEQESLRNNFDQKTTTDSSRDNKTYILDVVSAQEDLVATVSFVAMFGTIPNVIILPIGIELFVGQKIRITGSLNNDNVYNIIGAATLFFFQIIQVDIALTDEIDVSVFIEFLNGRVYELDRSVTPDSGVADVSLTSIYNVRLRPSALFERHYSWFAGLLHKYELEKILFVSSNRNADLVVAGIKDGRDIFVNALGSKMFLPYYLEFDTQTPSPLVEELEDDVNLGFNSNWNDVNYKGFIWNCGIAPNTLQQQTFKLLSFPDNDLTKLIL